MTVMPAPSSHHQWYLARDGEQYGPLTDAELAKFVELGHLQPTDLLWREGFPEWRPALVVFPPLAAGAGGRKEAATALQAGAKPAAAPSAAPSMDAMRPGADAVAAGKPASAAADSDADLEPRRRFLGGRLLKRLLLIAIILAGVWFAWLWRADLGRFIGAFSTSSPTSVLAATDRNGIDVPPLRGFLPDAA